MTNYKSNDRVLVNLFGLNPRALATFVPATVKEVEPMKKAMIVELDRPLDTTSTFTIRDLSRIKRPQLKN